MARLLTGLLAFALVLLLGAPAAAQDVTIVSSLTRAGARFELTR